MEIAMRILRRCAAIVNGLCVLAVLALLVPGVVMRAAQEWQNTPNPTLLGYTVAVEENDAMAPVLEEGSLVLLKQPEQYILDDFTGCRLDGHTVFGIVLASRGTDFDLGLPEEKTILAEGVPQDLMLGEVHTIIPQYGSWLAFAWTDKGLLLWWLLAFCWWSCRACCVRAKRASLFLMMRTKWTRMKMNRTARKLCPCRDNIRSGRKISGTI